MSNLLYNACEFSQPTTDATGSALPPCLNEGLYHCRICKLRFCDEHLCRHLVAQYDQIATPTHDATLFDYVGCEDASEHSFSEYSDDQIRNVPEMYLRSRLQRLMREAKRVQRELERRMIFNAEYRKSRISPNYVRVASSTSKVANEAKREAKHAAKQEKTQQTINDAMAILATALKSGSVTKSQLYVQVQKVRKA